MDECSCDNTYLDVITAEFDSVVVQEVHGVSLPDYVSIDNGQMEGTHRRAWNGHSSTAHTFCKIEDCQANSLRSWAIIGWSPGWSPGGGVFKNCTGMLYRHDRWVIFVTDAMHDTPDLQNWVCLGKFEK